MNHIVSKVSVFLKTPAVKKTLNVLKIILIYIFIIVSFIPEMHYNIYLQYISKNVYRLSPPLRSISQSYQQSTKEIVEFGRRIGMTTTWRMYSPPWKDVMWIDWYAQDINGNWTYVETPNLSQRYRERRDFWTAYLFDFKQARIQHSLVHSSSFRLGYAKWLCLQLDTDLGWSPQAIRLYSKRKRMPLPADRGDWSPADESTVERKIPLGNYKCT